MLGQKIVSGLWHDGVNNLDPSASKAQICNFHEIPLGGSYT